MRPRWSEKAIDVTLGLDDLDDEQRAAVLSLAEQVMPRTEQIRERAIEGKATEAVTRVLANYLGVPKSRLELVSGATARVKRFRVS